ncbi:MAG: response regulator, partial [Thermoanaerobaculia bacterium]|nr:response regulator [Thermoanaerobaculia bacterium]
MSLRVAVVDDEELARAVVLEHLAAHPDVTVVAECANGLEAIEAVAAHAPDLLFLDVQMPRLTGFETLELLDPRPAVVFVTAYDRHAVRAFEVNAVDYLLKPFSRER